MKSILAIVAGIILIAITHVYSAPKQGSSKQSSESASQKPNRFQELFIWKVSEELKLSVKKEQEFSKLIRNSNSQREKNRAEIDGILVKMKSVKSDRESKSLVAAYQKAWSTYYKTRESELEQIIKVLGPLKTAKYLVVRDKVTQGLKLILADPKSKQSPKTLAKPKIIEE